MSMRLLPCLFLLCSSPVSAQVMRPDFDRGVDAARVLQGIKADRPALPALKAEPQSVFQYKLKHYPKEAGACLPIAQRIGADMAKASGVKVLRSVCESEDASGYNIAVSYEAPEEAEPVSTLTHSLYQHGFGGFPDYAACKAALDGEVQAFRKATGLQPVAAFCYPSPYSEKKPWSIRIDGFGKAQLLPDTRTALLFTYPKGWTEEKFTGQIKARLIEQGVDARAVVWRPDAGYASVDVSYYAKDRLDLKFEEPSKVDTQAQCEEMLAELNKQLAGRTPPLIHFCGSTMVGGWEISWMYKGQPSLKALKASEEFKGYADCLAGRDKVIQYYRESMGHSVAGALCTSDRDDIDSRGWKVVLLEE